MGNQEGADPTRMSEAVEHELLKKQRECTFMWTNRTGEAFGVVMSYLAKDGRLWLNTQGGNARVKSLERTPRASICINSSGTSMGSGKTLTYKGNCTVHERRDLKDWFFGELSSTLMPNNSEAASAYRSFLDGPGKVIIEFEPTYRLGFDASSMSVLRQA